MSNEVRTCANPECNNTFISQAHNAIYCGDECRRLITNQRVLENYYSKREEKEIKRTTKRICDKQGCGTILSIYNDETICEAHKTERLIVRLTEWGWDEDELREDWSY